MESPAPAQARLTFHWIWLVVAMVVGLVLGWTGRTMVTYSKIGPTGTCIMADTTTVFANSITKDDCLAKCGSGCTWHQN